MPHIEYVPRKFSENSEAVIFQAREICDSYQRQGYDLTLRQLFYQFVSRDLMPNSERDYKRLGSIVNDARLAGMIDWYQIVDRTRVAHTSPSWESPADIIDGAAHGFVMDLWADQPTHVEVWIEKEALAGVLGSCCPGERVTYFSCRGYTSASATWRAAQRIGEAIDAGKDAVVIHLGDHDPSGIDMTRDITERLAMFVGQDRLGSPLGMEPDEYVLDVEHKLTIKRIALNEDQIAQHNPPPNPAKLSDSRASGYIERFGTSSWELDALEPSLLVRLITEEIDKHRDIGKWEAAIENESEERKVLTAVSKRWDDVKDFLS
jgi:hypothetical protein